MVIPHWDIFIVLSFCHTWFGVAYALFLEKKRINTLLFNSLLNIIFHHGHKKHYFSPSIVMAIVTCSVQQARAWKPKVIFFRSYTTLNDLSALFPRIRTSRTPEVSGWNAKQIRSTDCWWNTFSDGSFTVALRNCISIAGKPLQFTGSPPAGLKQTFSLHVKAQEQSSRTIIHPTIQKSLALSVHSYIKKKRKKELVPKRLLYDRTELTKLVINLISHV